MNLCAQVIDGCSIVRQDNGGRVIRQLSLGLGVAENHTNTLANQMVKFQPRIPTTRVTVGLINTVSRVTWKVSIVSFSVTLNKNLQKNKIRKSLSGAGSWTQAFSLEDLALNHLAMAPRKTRHVSLEIWENFIQEMYHVRVASLVCTHTHTLVRRERAQPMHYIHCRLLSTHTHTL